MLGALGVKLALQHEELGHVEVPAQTRQVQQTLAVLCAHAAMIRSEATMWDAAKHESLDKLAINDTRGIPCCPRADPPRPSAGNAALASVLA